MESIAVFPHPSSLPAGWWKLLECRQAGSLSPQIWPLLSDAQRETMKDLAYSETECLGPREGKRQTQAHSTSQDQN